MSPELRSRIQESLKAFATTPTALGAKALLRTLGYYSERTVSLDSTAAAFLEFIGSQSTTAKFDQRKALVEHWKSVDLLFQLTDSELSGHLSLFKDNAIAPGLMRSYVFFAIDLGGADHPRGKLTDIARQLNRMFPMPVMVLIRHIKAKKPVLSIAVINRRQSKRDALMDVLGKVTIIRDISLTDPHRGHVEILSSFALSNLEHPQRLPINSFDSLHAAWEQIFNVAVLNERFYRELANWYFWALPQVEFPNDIEKDDEKRRATSLIRLLTRLIFCWFLKEKGLVPDSIFLEPEVDKALVNLDDDTSTYYQAILQNLFFATLNQRMGKDKNGQPFRAFVDSAPQKLRTLGSDTLYRYEELFRDRTSALELFASVPFLNGGLFECLDRIEDGTNRKLYLDGFSREPTNRASVPNKLFFATEHTVDLSNAYGESKRRNETVRGLIHILQSYKFTIVENTPIDQEIALDPELLGKVFENLLASYVEETRTTARKQTGSFYTPRPIVEYMVDETLKCHLANALTSRGVGEEAAASGLEVLFAYTEKQHPFTDAEADALLEAIHTCKVLDPACGSGAFPMGMLQKLVYVIHKLDPRNAKWKRLQIQAASDIPDSTAREAAIAAIERNFSENADDYGRKLYLIENCLYGVDIQPIAIQISKLRFFISLICDQQISRNRKDNHGVRPLPNLETKFVAADTLIGLPELGQMALAPARVYHVEAEIEAAYHSHFGIQRRDQKLAVQKKIKELRAELADLLASSLMAPRKARHVADWDPFDPQESADFFDPHWMFGRTLSDGFDIVIGNPPYLRIQGIQQSAPVAADYYKKHYSSATGSFDLYVIFMERGLQLLRDGGVLSFINPDKWVNASFGKGIRRLAIENRNVHRLISLGAHQVFSASTYSSLLWMGKSPADAIKYARISPDESADTSLEEELSRLDCDSFTLIPYESLSEAPWILSVGEDSGAMAAVRAHQRTLGHVFEKMFQGIASSKDSVYFLKLGVKNGETWTAFSQELGEYIEIENGLVRPLLMGDQVHRFEPLATDNIVVFPYDDGVEATRLLSATEIEDLYPKGWSYLKRCEAVLRSRERGRFDLDEWFQFGRKQGISNGGQPKLLAPDISLGGNVSIDKQGQFYTTTTLYGYIKRAEVWESYEYWLAIMNSSVLWFYLRSTGSVLANGYFRYKPAYLVNFPVPEVTCEDESVVASLVETLLVYNSSCDAETSTQKLLEDLVDACVLECYFKQHMEQRDLLFLSDVREIIHRKEARADATATATLIYEDLLAPTSKLRNKLLRITAESPELLAVIKAGGST